MSAPERALPERPSLEQQRNLARELLTAYEASDPDAASRVRAQLPDKERIALSDAQFVLAREYGFASWAALKAHIEAGHRRLPSDLHHAFRQAFERGDVDDVRALVDRFPAARAHIDEPLFPFDTPALVHFAGRDDLAMVELLLELGADPNRRSDWWAGGFHALHSARGPVADRLLEAGAVPDACAAAQLDRPDMLRAMLEVDPSRVHERGGDGQTPLHFARSREVVDLLIEHGGGIDARDRDHRSTPAEWMLEGRRGAGRYDLALHLVHRGATVDVFLAAALGLADQLREMLDADPSLAALRTGVGEYAEKPPSSFHIYTWTLGQHLTPLDVAHRFEQPAVIEVLSSFSSPEARLLAACARADSDEAETLLRRWPRLVDRMPRDDMRALPDAAWAGNAAGVHLMLSLGFDPAAAGQDGGTVLHCAAWQGAADCIEAALRHEGARALIERADPTHGSTPLGWCCHGARHCCNPGGDYPEVARLLLDAGARPGPNLADAPEDVLAVIRAHGGSQGRGQPR